MCFGRALFNNFRQLLEYGCNESVRVAPLFPRSPGSRQRLNPLQKQRKPCAETLINHAGHWNELGMDGARAFTVRLSIIPMMLHWKGLLGLHVSRNREDWEDDANAAASWRTFVLSLFGAA